MKTLSELYAQTALLQEEWAKYVNSLQEKIDGMNFVNSEIARLGKVLDALRLRHEAMVELSLLATEASIPLAEHAEILSLELGEKIQAVRAEISRAKKDLGKYELTAVEQKFVKSQIEPTTKEEPVNLPTIEEIAAEESARKPRRKRGK